MKKIKCVTLPCFLITNLIIDSGIYTIQIYKTGGHIKIICLFWFAAFIIRMMSEQWTERGAVET